MRIDLEGLDLFFPYDFMYKEQYEYMLQLKRAIDKKGHALLEMPTGLKLRELAIESSPPLVITDLAIHKLK